MRNVWSYLPPNISTIRSWRMRCMGHIQITGDNRNACEIYSVHLQNKYDLKSACVMSFTQDNAVWIEFLNTRDDCREGVGWGGGGHIIL